MTIADFITLAFSLLALILSAYSIYLQYTVQGPQIEILNVVDAQQSVIRPHSALPKKTQDRFPDVVDQWAGYALVKLVYGNSGDRVGFANIKSIDVRAKRF